MPPEIADSDAESDIDGPCVAKLAKTPAPSATPAPPASEASNSAKFSPSNMDFDQFMSPTQRLSNATSTPDELQRGTASTERLLQNLAGAQTGLVGSSSERRPSNGPNAETQETVASFREVATKRRHTDLEDSLEKPDDRPEKKRAKTYGSKSRTGPMLDGDLFSETCLSLQNKPTSRGPELSVSATGDSTSDSSVLIGDIPRERDRPRRVVSLLGDPTTAVGHQLSTSVASMGGHKFINLDFRASGQGSDVNANPFGALSQVSTTSQPNTPHTERLAKFFSHPDPGETVVAHNVSTSSFDDTCRDVRMSPSQPNTVDPEIPSAISPSKLVHSIDSPLSGAEERPSKRRKTDMAAPRNPGSPVPASHRRAASLSAEAVLVPVEKPLPKKRGRKSKNSRVSSTSPAPAIEHDDQVEPNSNDQAIELPVDAYQAIELPVDAFQPCHSRSRRGTADSLSRASDPSEALKNSKRKEKDQATNDKSMRLSPDQEAESSPVKLPTSELNLSDEAVIGMPKESYKPRPSRSRSKRFTGDDTSAPESKEETTSALQPPSLTESIPARGIKKNARKSKVKRAKTSAAALLRKSEQMISDGEDDVLWLDEKPGVVKLELPPDLRALKKEEEQTGRSVEKGVKSSVSADLGDSKAITLTIEIPPPAEASEAEAAKPSEPQKRGRKPKKTTAPADAAEESPAETTNNNSAQKPVRPALIEKDANISTVPTSNTLEPISLSDPNHLPDPTQSESQGQENIIPSKPQPTPTPSPSKGPTSHSPINPPNSKLKSRYRVGLSRRQNIPSLLRKVDKSKEPPKIAVRKEKEKKKKDKDDNGSEDEDNGLRDGMRDARGELIEWEF